MKQDLTDILDGIKSLEPFPHVALRVLELATDEETLPRDLIAVIERDAAITAKVLKLCNSAIYGFQCQIGSLLEAGNLLGVRKLTDLVMTTCTNRYFRDYGGSTEESASALWAQSIGTAMCARQLVMFEPEVDPNRAYTTGLLQDIGQLVLDRYIHKHWEQILREVEGGADLLDAEKSVIGMDHAEVGARLAARWQLPDFLVDTIRWHHEPARASVDPLLTWYAHLADGIHSAIGSETEAVGEEQPTVARGRYGLSPHALDATGLKPDDVRNVQELTRAEIDTAREALAV